MSTIPMNMCASRMLPIAMIVTPSAISSTASTTPVALVRISLPAVPP